MVSHASPCHATRRPRPTPAVEGSQKVPEEPEDNPAPELEEELEAELNAAKEEFKNESYDMIDEICWSYDEKMMYPDHIDNFLNAVK